jgi:hypothetical protein
MTKERKLYTIEVLNILNWANKQDGIIATAKLPIKLAWELRKNLKKFQEIQEQYNQFDKTLQEKYATDAFSYETTDENGNVARKVKDEYVNEFSAKKQEILFTENTVELTVFDINNFGDIDVNISDMEMLNYFLNDTETEDE